MSTEIICGILVPVGAIFVYIVYLIVRWKSGENCPFVSLRRCCSEQNDTPQSSHEDAIEPAEDQPLTNGESSAVIEPAEDQPLTNGESSAAIEPAEDQPLTNGESSADSTDPEMTALEAKSKEEHSFVLDYIGRKATTDIITKAVRILGIIDTSIKHIQGSYLKDQAELNVQLLFKWYQNVGDVKNAFVLLAETLKDINVGGRYLTEICFSKKQFTYEMGELENEDLQEIDVTRAVSKIRNFSSLVRFWGLEESILEKIKSDHRTNSEEQANSAIQKCLKKELITKRKDLCDGLLYIDKVL